MKTKYSIRQPYLRGGSSNLWLDVRVIPKHLIFIILQTFKWINERTCIDFWWSDQTSPANHSRYVENYTCEIQLLECEIHCGDWSNHTISIIQKPVMFASYNFMIIYIICKLKNGYDKYFKLFCKIYACYFHIIKIFQNIVSSRKMKVRHKWRTESRMSQRHIRCINWIMAA